jgi:hypothetical protein
VLELIAQGHRVEQQRRFPVQSWPSSRHVDPGYPR